MNWPKLVRQIFDIHGLLPNQIGELTLDQIWVLTCDEKELEGQRTMTGTAESLIAAGVLDNDPEATTLFDLLYPETPKPPRSNRQQRIDQALKAARE